MSVPITFGGEGEISNEYISICLEYPSDPYRLGEKFRIWLDDAQCEALIAYLIATRPSRNAKWRAPA